MTEGNMYMRALRTEDDVVVAFLYFRNYKLEKVWIRSMFRVRETTGWARKACLLHLR